jgi:hypothetical protein
MKVLVKTEESVVKTGESVVKTGESVVEDRVTALTLERRSVHGPGHPSLHTLPSGMVPVLLLVQTLSSQTLG